MSVFVGIEMRHVDSGGLNLANLSAGLRLDLPGVQASGQGACRKTLQPIAETGGAGIAGSERGQSNRVKNRLAINQYNMATHAEARQLLCQLHGIVEGRPTGHEGGRSYDSVGVSLDDRAVHSPSEAKIIGIYDQASHREQSSRGGLLAQRLSV